MNHEQKSNTIATYALIQEAINNNSNLVIQVFGFSLAAIISIILASIATVSITIKLSYIWFALLIIVLSSIYISSQTKSLVETEAYISVFLEPKIDQYLQWRKIINKRNRKGRSLNKKYMFRPPRNFPDFYPFVYSFILIYIVFIVADSITTTTEKLVLGNILLAIGLIITTIVVWFFVLGTTEYSKEKYYQKCKQDFEEQKQQEESLKPSQEKLVDSNGKEIPIPESTYQVLRKVTEIMASGQAVSVIPQKDKVSIQEAADILNVSQPFLVKLLEQGNIPSTQVGSEKYIRFEDLISYKKQRDMQRREGLKELTQFLQNEGFYEENGVKFDS